MLVVVLFVGNPFPFLLELDVILSELLYEASELVV